MTISNCFVINPKFLIIIIPLFLFFFLDGFFSDILSKLPIKPIPTIENMLGNTEFSDYYIKHTIFIKFYTIFLLMLELLILYGYILFLNEDFYIYVEFINIGLIFFGGAFCSNLLGIYWKSHRIIKRDEI